MGQTKIGSLLEALTNTLIGLVIAFFAMTIITSAYNIQVSHQENFIITFWMTIVSISRSYILRRLFNRDSKSEKNINGGTVAGLRDCCKCEASGDR